jgi:hypothetical protein
MPQQELRAGRSAEALRQAQNAAGEVRDFGAAPTLLCRTGLNEREPNEESNQIRPNPTKSNRIKPNQTESGEV